MSDELSEFFSGPAKAAQKASKDLAVLKSIIERLELAFNDVNKYLLDPRDGMIVTVVNLENRVIQLEKWCKIVGTLFLIVFAALVSYIFGWLPTPYSP